MLNDYDRTERVIKYVFEHKIAKINQIHRDCIPNIVTSSAYRAVSRLCQLNYLRKIPYMEGKNLCRLFSISKKGLSLLNEIYEYKIDQPILSSYSIRHDLNLLDIIEAMKKYEMVTEVVTENALRSCSGYNKDPNKMTFSKLHSDAFMKLNIHDQSLNFALEYDLTRKAKKRYRQKFKEYYDSNRVHVVLYLTDSRRLQDMLMEIDSEICAENRSKFFFCLRKKVLLRPDKVIFTNCKDEEIAIM